MNARCCDRCDEYYTPAALSEEIEGANRLLEMITDSKYTARLDLCAECAKKLRLMLNNFGELVREH